MMTSTPYNPSGPAEATPKAEVVMPAAMAKSRMAVVNSDGPAQPAVVAPGQGQAEHGRADHEHHQGGHHTQIGAAQVHLRGHQAHQHGHQHHRTELLEA